LLKHHANLRQRAIHSLEGQSERELHYSGIFSMDEKTAQKMKEKFLELMKEQQEEIQAAKDEDLFVVGIDLFRA
jgi:hypothetical protein